MTALWLLIGIGIGALVVALALRQRLRVGSVQAARAGELERELIRAHADLEHERSLFEQRLATLKDAQEQLAVSFKALSAEALQASMSQLAELAQAQLRATQAEAKGELDKRQQAVEQLVAPLKDQLGRVDAQLLRLDQERRESRGRMESQLKTLTETGERLRSETGALVTALRKPNTRGQWGQMQLRNVVELAGMLRHCDFVEQSSFRGESILRPDLVVRMPGGKHVVVDAKAPLQGVLDAYEARDEEERERHLQAHARLLRKHVKSLADKAYWEQLDSAPDFVVMFLPGEHLYGAALDADPALLEDAMTQRVLIATPTTLLAILRAVSYGWQQERVAESAQAISELGRDLHGRLVKLATMLATLGHRLNSTVRAYNETVGSYEARVLPAARRFADHGAVSEGREMPEVEQVTLSARSVHAAELPEEEAGAVAELPRLFFNDTATTESRLSRPARRYSRGVALRTDTFDLAGLRLVTGEGRRLELHVAVEPLELAGERYVVGPALIPATLEISRTTGNGYALRLRFEAALEGPCMRCLEQAAPTFEVDAREVSQPGRGPLGSPLGDELISPYIKDGLLDMAAWARDSLVLTVPTQLLCRADCAGLCPVCGADLNQAAPEHAHQTAPDPRWSKLSELRFE